MNLKDIYNKMVDIQKALLCYLDNSDNIEENYQNLNQIFIDQKVHDNKYDVISIFHLITKIANNHHRKSLFYDKIIKILQLFEEDIKNYFTPMEIFNIFKKNKRIILFLIESVLLNLDTSMIETMISYPTYVKYFAPEINASITGKFREKHKYDYFMYYLEDKIPDGFYEKRRTGENDTLLCQLIREDSVEKFVSYIKENNIQLDSLIPNSIYETNSFLSKKMCDNEYLLSFCSHLTLIAYAAAVGSNKIFKYLMDNDVKLVPNLWTYAVFGNNLEVIKILEEKKISTNSIKNCIIDSIKCHHNDITNYLISNKYHFGFLFPLKYHNYIQLNIDEINNTAFYYLCKYDYPSFVKIILQNYDLDINENIILEFNNFMQNFIRFIFLGIQNHKFI